MMKTAPMPQRFENRSTTCRVDVRRGVEALYAVGHFLHARDRYREATSFFRVMLIVAPSDARGWRGLASCHERLGQIDIAAELYAAGSLVTGTDMRCRAVTNDAER